MERIEIPFEEIELWLAYRDAMEGGYYARHDGEPFRVESVEYDEDRDKVIVKGFEIVENYGGEGNLDAPIA